MERLFEGVKICVTSILQRDRAEIARAAAMCGGAYSADLDQTCTHLLVGKAEGPKFETALAWRLHTVDPDWFWTSIDNGVRQDEEAFRIAPPRSAPAAADPAKLFLRNLVFYASAGVRRIYGELFDRLVSSGGGRIAATLSDKVTHYVVVRPHLEKE